MARPLARSMLLLLAPFVFFLMGCSVGNQIAEQKTLLHVFAYTPLGTATQQDFENFKKTTEDMVGKIPGLRKVWVAKLREPIPAGDKIRSFAVGMEFDNLQALEGYAGNPIHKQWEQVYERVQEQGTTTLDIIP